MPDITSTNWFPVLTLLIGYGTRSLSDWLQHRRSVERERDAREATRRDRLFERRSTFQRDTLLALQEATMRLARATGAIHHQDTMSFRSTGIWQRQLLPDDLNEGFRLAQVETSTLAARVRDDATRELVARFRKLCADSVISVSQAQGDGLMTNMSPMLDDLNQRIGELLRTLDDADTGS
jgi:hypothetical protein